MDSQAAHLPPCFTLDKMYPSVEIARRLGRSPAVYFSDNCRIPFPTPKSGYNDENGIGGILPFTTHKLCHFTRKGNGTASRKPQNLYAPERSAYTRENTPGLAHVIAISIAEIRAHHLFFPGNA